MRDFKNSSSINLQLRVYLYIYSLKDDLPKKTEVILSYSTLTLNNRLLHTKLAQHINIVCIQVIKFTNKLTNFDPLLPYHLTF